MSSHVDPPKSDEVAQKLKDLGDDWSGDREWQPQLAGLFVETSDGKGRVYFSSEPGLFVEFELKAVERYDSEATRVILKPDQRVRFNFTWTSDPASDDDFELQAQRVPESQGAVRLSAAVEGMVSQGFSRPHGCPPQP